MHRIALHDWEVRLHVPDVLHALEDFMVPHIVDIEALAKNPLPGVRSQEERTLELLDIIPEVKEAYDRVHDFATIADDMDAALQAEILAAHECAAPSNTLAVQDNTMLHSLELSLWRARPDEIPDEIAALAAVIQDIFDGILMPGLPSRRRAASSTAPSCSASRTKPSGDLSPPQRGPNSSGGC